MQQNFGGVIGGGDEVLNYVVEQHGTAVAGIIGGDSNGYGVEGIAPNSLFFEALARPKYKEVGYPPTRHWLNSGIAAAIDNSIARAQPGDVICIPLQAAGDPKYNRPLLPIELDHAVFNSILKATERGIIVVEAASNGGANLDDEQYVFVTNGVVLKPRPFSPETQSSGGIVVGAGSKNASRLTFSAYGSRVDVQAWGENVASTEACSTNDCYTDSFSGTSAASPIIAGVVASTQGVLKAMGLRVLTANEFRTLFRDPSTGWPQTPRPGGPVTCNIGRRPDMKMLIPQAIALARQPLKL